MDKAPIFKDFTQEFISHLHMCLMYVAYDLYVTVQGLMFHLAYYAVTIKKFF